MLKKIVIVTLSSLVIIMARTQTITNTMPSDLPLIPENTELLTKSLFWQQTLKVRTGAGYRDNVLDSPTNALGSALLAGGADYSLIRLPLDGFGVTLFVTGDSFRYLQNVPTHGEDAWIGSAMVKKYFADNWQAGFEAREQYEDERAYALSTNGVSVAEITGNFVTAQPFVRYDFNANWWLQTDFPATRALVDAPLDNTWNYGPKLTLGFARTPAMELDLSYELQRINNDTLHGLAPGGTNDAGGTLNVWQHLAELQWRQTWGAKSDWSSNAKLGFEYEEDNAGGYFNYYQGTLSDRLRYETKSWQIATTLRAAWQYFPVQRTEINTGPDLNILMVSASLRLERRLTTWLKLYTEYIYERALSNQSTDAYQGNTAVAGAIWEF